MTPEKYEEYNKRCRRMNGVTAKHIFTLKINEDAKRFEFTPVKNGFTSYTIGFEETQDESKAWEIIEEIVNG